MVNLNKKELNKKGGFYWIAIFLVLAAIFTFLLLSSTSKPEAGEGTMIKGAWQISFLKDNYLEAEKKLLQNDIAAITVGREAALELASNGGFLSSPESNSPCGQIDKINLWNEKGRFCFPDIKKNVASSVGEKLKLKSSGQQFTGVGYSGTTLFAKGKRDSITSPTGIYEYDTSFAVNIKYSFDEYEQIEKEAATLLSSCKNNADLNKCLDQNRQTHWKYVSCEQEAFSQKDMKVIFCVESPSKYTFSAKENGLIKTVPVRYKLALDFTAEEVTAEAEQQVS